MAKENKNKKTVATETAKVEKFNLATFKSSTIAHSFSKENDVYKKEVYIGLNTDREKGRFRSKIRRTLIDYMQGFITLQSQKDSAKLAELKKEFTAFYGAVYKVNDYSLTSVLAANASDKNKMIVTQGMEIAKEI